MTRPTIISLFTGAGGMDAGFHAAGFSTRVAVEMDSQCCATLTANKKAYAWEIIESPIEDVPTAAILSTAQLKAQQADLLIGGPPCQPFSKSGYWATGDSRRLKDPRAATLSEYLRVLAEARPRVFVLENVGGMAYEGKSEALEFISHEVQRINRVHRTKYTVATALLNAADYGVPQTRERFFIVGSRDGRTFEFPPPMYADPSLGSATAHWFTAWDALGDLGVPDDLNETAVRGRWAPLLPTIPEGCNYAFHTDRGGSDHHLFGWRRRYWSFLLKLSKRRPSWTLTAQPGPGIGPFHWKNRRLARRELMRLQTFPDDYFIEGALCDVQRQAGNAVPSLLAEVLGRAIASQLLDRAPSDKRYELLPRRRRDTPSAERLTKVPVEFAALHGKHLAHPGTGLGYAAALR